MIVKNRFPPRSQTPKPSLVPKLRVFAAMTSSLPDIHEAPWMVWRPIMEAAGSSVNVFWPPAPIERRGTARCLDVPCKKGDMK